jgi:hypothetical protein
MEEPVPIDSLVAAYRKLRAAITEEEEAYEARVSALKEKLELVSAELLKFCNDNDADSVKTASGTVSRRVQTRYWTTDWDQMYQFIDKHDAPFVLEKRIHSGNMKQFLEENPDVLPVGLQIDNKYVIQVRKPTTK